MVIYSSDERHSFASDILAIVNKASIFSLIKISFKVYNFISYFIWMRGYVIFNLKKKCAKVFSKLVLPFHFLKDII